MVLLSCITLQAQNSNNLIVFSEGGERFYLVLNGLRYNTSPETNVKVTGLNATNYKAKIIFEKPVGDLNSNVYLMWEGNAVNNQEFTYAIRKKGDKYQLKMVSHAEIGPQTAGGSSVVYNSTAGVPEAQSTTVTQTSSAPASNGSFNSSTTVTTTTASSGPQNGNVTISMNADGMNMNINMSGNAPAGAAGTSTVTTTSYTTSSTSYSSGSTVNATPASSSAPVNGGCSNAMNDASFSDLQKSIEAKSFEDVKLKIAKQGISSNCVNAAQVRKLMDLFSFEENKLELTKFAYDFTTDKNNYFKVNDGFSFESTVDELNDYIAKKK